MNKQVIAAIRETVREALSPITRGYLDATEAAHYLSFGLRTFDGGPAREIPCHRVTPAGKRLYKREDLDRYMLRHRQAPRSKAQVDALVDEVVRQVRAK